jgi:hypothetical protein
MRAVFLSDCFGVTLATPNPNAILSCHRDHHDRVKRRRRREACRMSFLSALDFQKRPAAPDFKNQPETARCLIDFCEKT